ncbi:MAG: hypothetical protein US68_C0010G0018 [Candidatus Shapirobacteria bacterium GW2011_GWE1_38_10]|uniref:Uncharacterized protein n=1 Tax=Candidatus Shapirobacteria bacterium GW2011_GWE1_38_10 TaxID=1618488 RepID=A0A0G0IFV9_9BACT|nr:MAG: hypothetical protein US46_C0008G0041 [Candidatus Shapirobacteria bacterium GW2011_GWF2_37_20]KKQ49885.1 MAG: hypothetical protein US68_C0010G0018 [Candidatus Shapirobacteria bacterium GW2011_GWE1_38_10]KKQ64183.1 MAG: hypothetical protein US85_C0012G0014 [Candidatus Shapirobacteria bacterium GW2011_GWF1_38_23]HBP50729.1 hypothetical protein [Candidatus Shapirobacteria bacterium]
MFPDFTNYLVLVEKIFGIVGSLIYLIFALVIVKQVNTMTRNVRDKFNGILIVFSYIHLVVAILLVFLAWIIL